MLGSRAGAALRRHQSVEALRDLGSGLKGLLWHVILNGMVASGDEGHIQDGEVGLHEAVDDHTLHVGGGGAELGPHARLISPGVRLTLSARRG